MNLSPFSAYHDWKLQWEVIPSSDRVNVQGLYANDFKSKLVVSVLSEVGVLGSSQLKNELLDRNRKRMKILENQKIIKRHLIRKGGQDIPLFTLGITGLDMAGKLAEKNQWLGWDEMNVLQRLLLFQLYTKVRDKAVGKEVIVENAPYPLSGRIHVGDEQSLNVLIIRKNESDIIKYLDRHKLKGHTVVICEDLVYLTKLNEFLKEAKVRVITDDGLKNEDFQEAFYLWDRTKWRKEHEWMDEQHSKREASGSVS